MSYWSRRPSSPVPTRPGTGYRPRRVARRRRVQARRRGPVWSGWWLVLGLLLVGGWVLWWSRPMLHLPTLLWLVGGLALLGISQAGDWWLWHWWGRERARLRAARLCALQALDPLAFERQVGQWFAQAGYRVSYTPRSGDEGIDLWLEGPAFKGRWSWLERLKALVGGGRASRIPVQCKRYGADHAVGSPELQTFSGALRRAHAMRGIFVTTSRFTPAAVTWAKHEGIQLIDGAALARGLQGPLPDETGAALTPAPTSASGSHLDALLTQERKD